jgi:putative lipase involved disintegration of autophagic bodies
VSWLYADDAAGCRWAASHAVLLDLCGAYNSVKVKVLRLVDQLTADASKEKPWDVFVTGHSLGVALATLCAYDLAGRR